MSGESERLEFLFLHDATPERVPDLITSCVELLNAQWPRSESAR